MTVIQGVMPKTSSKILQHTKLLGLNAKQIRRLSVLETAVVAEQ